MKQKESVDLTSVLCTLVLGTKTIQKVNLLFATGLYAYMDPSANLSHTALF